MSEPTVYRGTFIDAPDPGQFRVRENCYLISSGGTIEFIGENIPGNYNSLPVNELGSGPVIPSFIDLHVHAPQHMQMGVGLDLELLDWLNQHTFPGESRFADPDYAAIMYPEFVKALVKNGSLRSVVFATVHLESTRILAGAMDAAGLVGFVGKVNMDQNAPPALTEDPSVSLEESLAFCGEYAGHPRIRPIVTPRFAPSCSSALMKSLGEYARKADLPVQSHLSENRSEAAWVAELFPGSASYTRVYEDHGLLKKGALMAHGIYLDENEIELIVERKARLVHCPSANINLSSGIMPLGAYIDCGVPLGLGSDVGAGHSLAMNRAIVQAVQSSKLLRILGGGDSARSVSLSEAFYLATTANGDYFAGQGMDNCGSFDIGKSFDALCLDMNLPPQAGLSSLLVLERFLYAGDDRNIARRILRGRDI